MGWLKDENRSIIWSIVAKTLDLRAQNKKGLVQLLVVFALGLVFIYGIYLLTTPRSAGNKLEANITSYRVSNPSLLTVEYQVKNTSDIPGKSSCDITMHDDSRTYSGSDFGYESAKQIQPNETYSGIANISISKEGAQYITSGGINCKIN